MASQSLPIFCPACGGHNVNPHEEVAQCHDCGHVVTEQQPQPEVK